MPSKTTDRRAAAADSARACAAGLCCGAHLFALAAGLGLPLCLNAAWLPALAAAPLCALVAAAASRWNGRSGRVLPALLAALGIAEAAFLLCAAACLAQHSLLPDARLAVCLGLCFAAAALASLARDTGVCRMAFALRVLLPVALLALSLRAVYADGLSGLFPLLGAGAGRCALALAAMSGAVAPAMMLCFPPSENPPDAARPGPGFFFLRVLAGALVGAALVATLPLCAPWETLAEQTEWGARMRVVGLREPSENIGSTLLALLQLLALVLAAAAQLASSAQALRRVGHGLPARALVPAACAAALIAVQAFPGAEAALPVGALLAPPAILMSILAGRRKKRR